MHSIKWQPHPVAFHMVSVWFLYITCSTNKYSAIHTVQSYVRARVTKGQQSSGVQFRRRDSDGIKNGIGEFSNYTDKSDDKIRVIVLKAQLAPLFHPFHA